MDKSTGALFGQDCAIQDSQQRRRIGFSVKIGD
jgi:hypothetical protein